MDYVDGMPWIEADDDLPICNAEFSSCPFCTFTSIPCKVVTDDNRITDAVYVLAMSVFGNNDGSRIEIKGWVEKTGSPDDYSCVEDIYSGKTINVLRWHYRDGLQMPTAKQLETAILALLAESKKSLQIKCQGTTSMKFPK